MAQLDDLTAVHQCLLCGSDQFVRRGKETALIGAVHPCAVVRCRVCGFTFLNPQRSVAYGERYYREYREKSCMAGGRDSTLPAYLVRRLERVEDAVGCGVMLEIGFAEGIFLNRAKERGWEAYGVEMSEWAASEAKKRFGLRNLYTGNLTDVRFGDSYFDFIHLNHVLEHVPALLDTACELKRIAKPKGLVVIEVPNEFDNLFEKVKSVMGMERKPYEVSSPHLWFFTPATLDRLIKKSGFSVREMRTVRRDKDENSGYFGGALLKRLIYVAEEQLRKGPLIELWAQRA